MKSSRWPALFMGHGSPMNAIQVNRYSRQLGDLGQKLGKPKAIVCVSAHWLTEGVWVTNMPQPKTIHDFFGFPKELSEVKYQAPGSPETASLVKSLIPEVILDNHKWGLDHGTWSVLKHLYPQADVPVVQLSISYKQPPEFHFQVGQRISQLRDREILVLGSGNIVHNLRQAKFEDDAEPFDWNVEFDQWAKNKIDNRDFSALVNDYNTSEAGRMSVPTPDHYYPLLYILGAAREDDRISYVYEGLENGSISMRSVLFGE